MRGAVRRDRGEGEVRGGGRREGEERGGGWESEGREMSMEGRGQGGGGRGGGDE